MFQSRREGFVFACVYPLWSQNIYRRRYKCKLCSGRGVDWARRLQTGRRRASSWLFYLLLPGAAFKQIRKRPWKLRWVSGAAGTWTTARPFAAAIPVYVLRGSFWRASAPTWIRLPGKRSVSRRDLLLCIHRHVLWNWRSCHAAGMSRHVHWSHTLTRAGAHTHTHREKCGLKQLRLDFTQNMTSFYKSETIRRESESYQRTKCQLVIKSNFELNGTLIEILLNRRHLCVLVIEVNGPLWWACGSLNNASQWCARAFVTAWMTTVVISKLMKHHFNHFEMTTAVYTQLQKLYIYTVYIYISKYIDSMYTLYIYIFICRYIYYTYLYCIYYI